MIFQRDIIETQDGSHINIVFYTHASVLLEWNGMHIYIDPVGDKYGIDFSFEPKADLILVTHHHKDHFDAEAIQVLSKSETIIYASKKCSLDVSSVAVPPNEIITYKEISIHTVAAYNITHEHLQYHPKHDEGLGYVLSIGGTNLFIAGDTEDNDDILSLKDIDIAFLPVNQPYTMTLEQVVNVVEALRPSILYPYHTGSQMGETDVTLLVGMLNGLCEVRIRNMK